MLRINNGGKILSSSNGIGIVGYPNIKEWNWSLFLLYIQKKNPKWIKKSNAKTWNWKTPWANHKGKVS